MDGTFSLTCVKELPSNLQEELHQRMTRWQTICTEENLEMLEMSELQAIAESIGISTRNKTKRDLCSELTHDFRQTLNQWNNVNGAHCTNSQSIELLEDWQNIPSAEIVEIPDQFGRTWCFTHNELRNLVVDETLVNPYTNTILKLPKRRIVHSVPLLSSPSHVSVQNIAKQYKITNDRYYFESERAPRESNLLLNQLWYALHYMPLNEFKHSELSLKFFILTLNRMGFGASFVDDKRMMKGVLIDAIMFLMNKLHYKRIAENYLKPNYPVLNNL
jgi:hypothetical protein